MVIKTQRNANFGESKEIVIEKLEAEEYEIKFEQHNEPVDSLVLTVEEITYLARLIQEAVATDCNVRLLSCRNSEEV